MISTSCVLFFFFFSSRRRHTRLQGDWSSDVCSSDLHPVVLLGMGTPEAYDGMGLDTLTYLLALEELAAADASIAVSVSIHNAIPTTMLLRHGSPADRKSTRLNSSHLVISYAVFCLKKKKKTE